MDLKMNDGLYNFLNSLVRIILPALGALYFGLSAAWDGALPYVTQVIGTITVLCTFLGLVIMLARRGWVVDDELLIDKSIPGETNFGLASGDLFENLKADQSVTFHVRDVTAARRKLLDEDGSA